MNTPQMTMHGSVSWINRRRWRPRPKNMAQASFDRIIIAGCTTKDQDFGDRTAEARGAVRQKYTQGRIIKTRTMRGGGCSSPDFTTEGVNNDMMVESRGSLESYRRHRTNNPNWFSEARNSVYKQSWSMAKALCAFIIRVRGKVSIVWYQRTKTSPGNQRTRLARPSDNMETRQKLRQVEEKQGAGDENRSRKGKIIMQEEPPFKVWEIEEESDEDSIPGAVNACKNHHKNLAEEGKPQTRVRRCGRRNRSSTPDKEKDRDGKRTRGQKGKEQEEGETSRRGQGNSRKQKETINHRVRRAEQAFRRYPNPAVRRVMQHLEEEMLQEHSDEDMEDCEFLLHDLGHTRGRISLFKQSLHIYWVVKGLLAKALE